MQHPCPSSYKSIFSHLSMPRAATLYDDTPNDILINRRTWREVKLEGKGRRKPAWISRRVPFGKWHLHRNTYGVPPSRAIEKLVTLEAAKQNSTCNWSWLGLSHAYRSCLLVFLHAFICQLTVTSSTWTHSALLMSWPRSRVTAVKVQKEDMSVEKPNLFV